MRIFRRLSTWLYCIFVAFILGAFALYCIDSTQTTSGNKGIDLIIKLNLDKDLSSHVGNEWTFSSYVNEKPIRSGQSITLSFSQDDKIQLEAAALESDTSPDKGSNSTIIDVSDLNLNSDNTYSLDVIVREDKGRYAGSAAHHKFNFIIKQKLTLADKIKNIIK